MAKHRLDEMSDEYNCGTRVLLVEMDYYDGKFVRLIWNRNGFSCEELT